MAPKKNSANQDADREVTEEIKEMWPVKIILFCSNPDLRGSNRQT
jgi:hypothetical protein